MIPGCLNQGIMEQTRALHNSPLLDTRVPACNLAIKPEDQAGTQLKVMLCQLEVVVQWKTCFLTYFNWVHKKSVCTACLAVRIVC